MDQRVYQKIDPFFSSKMEIWSQFKLQRLVVPSSHWLATHFISHRAVKSINVFSKLVDFLVNLGTVPYLIRFDMARDAKEFETKM